MQDFAAKKKRWIIVSSRKHTLCALVGARVLKKRECQFKLQEWGKDYITNHNCLWLKQTTATLLALASSNAYRRTGQAGIICARMPDLTLIAARSLSKWKRIVSQAKKLIRSFKCFQFFHQSSHPSKHIQNVETI